MWLLSTILASHLPGQMKLIGEKEEWEEGVLRGLFSFFTVGGAQRKKSINYICAKGPFQEFNDAEEGESKQCESGRSSS